MRLGVGGDEDRLWEGRRIDEKLCKIRLIGVGGVNSNDIDMENDGRTFILSIDVLVVVRVSIV